MVLFPTFSALSCMVSKFQCFKLFQSISFQMKCKCWQTNIPKHRLRLRNVFILAALTSHCKQNLQIHWRLGARLAQVKVNTRSIDTCSSHTQSRLCLHSYIPVESWKDDKEAMNYDTQSIYRSKARAVNGRHFENFPFF